MTTIASDQPDNRPASPAAGAPDVRRHGGPPLTGARLSPSGAPVTVGHSPNRPLTIEQRTTSHVDH
jgi:hypothetical protein